MKVVKGLLSGWEKCFRTVSLGSEPITLSYWGNTIAVGCSNSDIITLDAITGSQGAVLSGHTDWVRCVTFSSDGRSLASGSFDKTVKFWDMQTGGVVKTFHGHSHSVCSVAISGDNTKIASGSWDCAVCLWDILTGECIYTIKQQDGVDCVCFSPTDPHHIIFISDSKLWEWDINHQQISLSCNATSLAFSPDCTQLVLCHGEVIVVQNFNSGEPIAQSNTAEKKTSHSCFSPDGKLIAAAAGKTAYVWSITGPYCCLIETFVGHANDITALTFSSPSSLISVSDDSSLKFWKIEASSKNQTATNSEPPPPTLFPIWSVSLQARAGIAISSDLSGVVKTWDLLTGHCKVSIETPVGDCLRRDVQLIGSRLIIVWCDDNQIHTWDIDKNEPLWMVDSHCTRFRSLRISGDGTKIFLLTNTSIQAWSIDTGEYISKMELELKDYWYLDPLQIDGSRIWIRLEDLSTQGWDFGTSGSSLVPSSIGSAGRPLLDFIHDICWWTEKPSQIKDSISGKEVFQLSGRHVTPKAVQWDGQYLIAGYYSGELLILDFHHVYPQ